MNANVLEKLFEHNNWANLKVIEACSALSDEQLDIEPQSAVRGTIRDTLTHLVVAQHGYLALLTLPVDERKKIWISPVVSELYEAAKRSGEGLIALSRDTSHLPERLHTTDNYSVEPWVVMVQVINHATEHREQIKSMLSALGVTLPEIDGWDYGFATNTLVPMTK